MSTSESKKELIMAAHRCSVGELECECDSERFQVLKAGNDGSDPQVIYQLGMCHYFGWGIDKNLNVAIKCYVRAAGLGNLEALLQLYDLRNDQSAKTNIQNAFRGFSEKAGQGNFRAQFNAGYCHYWGVGTPEDKSKAKDLFQKAADQGCADAMWRLDYCRQSGFGDGYNGMQGIQLLKYAAELGSSYAQSQLGYAYYKGKTGYGLEVEKDYKQAVEQRQKAADQNHTWATVKLAWYYYKGKCVQRDVNKAFQLHRKAALMGNREAQDVIGHFYSHSLSGLPDDEYPVGIDYYEAAYWNRKAADQDDDDARESMPDIQKAIGLAQDQIDELMKQTSSFESAEIWYDIAKQHEIGNEVEKDDNKAFNIYKLSAKFGSIQAKTALGRCYETGIGTLVDLNQAAYWYEKATIQGDYQAAKCVLNLIQLKAEISALREESPFAALAECYEAGSGVVRNEDTALLMREFAAANGDIRQAKTVIEAYISGNGNEYRIKTVGSIVARTTGLSREDYQQFIELFNDSIDDLDKMQIFQKIAAAIRAESMGIRIVLD